MQAALRGRPRGVVEGLEDAPALESRFAALEAESSLAALRVRAGMEPSAPVPTTEDDDVLVRLRAAMNGESR